MPSEEGIFIPITRDLAFSAFFCWFHRHVCGPVYFVGHHRNSASCRLMGMSHKKEIAPLRPSAGHVWHLCHPPLQNCYSFSSMSFIIFLSAALEIKCRASHMPGKCSASDLYARSFEPFRWLFLVLHMVRLQLHSLGCRWAASPVPLCQEGCPFPIEWSWGICWKLINHTLWFVPFVCVSVSRPVPHCSD